MNLTKEKLPAWVHFKENILVFRSEPQVYGPKAKAQRVNKINQRVLELPRKVMLLNLSGQIQSPVEFSARLPRLDGRGKDFSVHDCHPDVTLCLNQFLKDRRCISQAVQL